MSLLLSYYSHWSEYTQWYELDTGTTYSHWDYSHWSEYTGVS